VIQDLIYKNKILTSQNKGLISKDGLIISQICMFEQISYLSYEWCTIRKGYPSSWIGNSIFIIILRDTIILCDTMI
jgi:hypothetical protein